MRFASLVRPDDVRRGRRRAGRLTVPPPKAAVSPRTIWIRAANTPSARRHARRNWGRHARYRVCRHSDRARCPSRSRRGRSPARRPLLRARRPRRSRRPREPRPRKKRPRPGRGRPRRMPHRREPRPGRSPQGREWLRSRDRRRHARRAAVCAGRIDRAFPLSWRAVARRERAGGSRRPSASPRRAVARGAERDRPARESGRGGARRVDRRQSSRHARRARACASRRMRATESRRDGGAPARGRGGRSPRCARASLGAEGARGRRSGRP